MSRAQKINKKFEKAQIKIQDISTGGEFKFRVTYPNGEVWIYPVSQATSVGYKESPPRNKGVFVAKLQKEAGNKAKPE